MKIRLSALLVIGLTASMVLAGTPPELKMFADIPAGIASPDKMQTRLGHAELL